MSERIASGIKNMGKGKQRKSDSGFSLIELMFVIGIIGIVSAITVPAIMNRMPEYRLREATRDVVSSLQEARMKAVNRNIDSFVFFDVGNNSYSARMNGQADYKTVNLPTNLILYQVTGFGASTAGFNSRGLLNTTAGSIYLRNNQSNARRIIVNLSGNVRVLKSGDNGISRK